jgi:hypothetical protein
MRGIPVAIAVEKVDFLLQTQFLNNRLSLFQLLESMLIPPQIPFRNLFLAGFPDID